jgi:hypothetical protein
MGFFFTVGGIALLSINFIARLKSPFWQRVWAFVALFILLYSMSKITGTYQIKSSWYNPGFYPPHYYTKGPYIRDQGSSF